jgi:hypothetical protein
VFLTAERSLTDIETLDGRWAVCRCPSDDIIGHNRTELMRRLSADMTASMARLITDPSKRAGGRSRCPLERGRPTHPLPCRYCQNVKPVSVLKVSIRKLNYYLYSQFPKILSHSV